MAKEQTQELTSVPVLGYTGSRETGSQEPPKSFRIQIILGIFSFFLFQIIIIWLLLPPLTSVKGNVGLRPGDIPNGMDNVPLAPPDISPSETLVARPLKSGAFKVSDIRDDMNEEFTLVMHVMIREKDADKFDILFNKRKPEILDRITTILRMSTSQEREEADSTSIKEKSKKEINEVLGTPWVQKVLITETLHKSL